MMNQYAYSSVAALLLIISLLGMGLTACSPKQNDPVSMEAGNNAQTDPQEPVINQEVLDRYRDAFQSFGLNPGDYDFYYDDQVEKVVTTAEWLGLRDLLDLKPGDILPAFLWDESTQTMYAAKRDSLESHFFYTFQRNPSADQKELSTLWTQVEEVKELSAGS